MKLENKKENESKIILNLDLDVENNTIEFDFIKILDEGKNDVLSKVQEVSLCHAQKQILPSPVGQRVKKKSFKAKTEILKFRCTLFERKVLEAKSKRSGITISEYCRRVVFDKEIVERLTDEEIDIYKVLIKYSNNFKSIGNMYSKKNPKLTAVVYELADEIKTHLIKFKK